MAVIVPEPLYRDLQLEAIKVRIKPKAAKFGKEYKENHWKISTAGWRYTLRRIGDRWVLLPENSSQVYRELSRLIREGLEEVWGLYDYKAD
jgi:hypothetical protein